MRIVAIDLGDKRTGLAVGDDETGMVSPLSVVGIPLKDEARLLDALAKAADDYAADALLVGLPLNMDGSEGPRAKLVRTFGLKLGARTDLSIHFQDERLTSADADWSMARSGLTRGQKKSRRDALAAAAILRDFLSRSDQAD